MEIQGKFARNPFPRLAVERYEARSSHASGLFNFSFQIKVSGQMGMARRKNRLESPAGHL